MKKSIFIISLSFLIVSCGQNFNTLQYNQQSKKYKICLKDANRNIETKLNINQDRNEMLQTDDTMIDFYNIENEIDEIKLSKSRSKMIEDCMK